MTLKVALTDYSRGGGCACKLPAGELELMLSALRPRAVADELAPAEVVVGLETGDDAAVVTVPDLPGVGIVMTADFFTPVVNDPYDWGRIAATNALSDVYAMGGQPIQAVNLLSWPRELLPLEVAQRVLLGGAAAANLARCALAGGHTVDDNEPKYGLAVSALVPLDRMLRIDAARSGTPLTLTKPLGIGVLNAAHKATGISFPDAVDVMTTLNRDAAAAAINAGARAATDVTGFGLLGHLFKLCRASRVDAVVDVGSVPFLEAARTMAARGYVPGGSYRNLAWVDDHLDAGGYSELDQVLLADAQTSGGLLVAGEVPGYPVIGELVPPASAGGPLISLR